MTKQRQQLQEMYPAAFEGVNEEAVCVGRVNKRQAAGCQNEYEDESIFENFRAPDKGKRKIFSLRSL